MLSYTETKSASYQDLTETESRSPVSYFSESEDDDSHSQHVSPANSRSSSRDGKQSKTDVTPAILSRDCMSCNFIAPQNRKCDVACRKLQLCRINTN